MGGIITFQRSNCLVLIVFPFLQICVQVSAKLIVFCFDKNVENMYYNLITLLGPEMWSISYGELVLHWSFWVCTSRKTLKIKFGSCWLWKMENLLFFSIFSTQRGRFTWKVVGGKRIEAALVLFCFILFFVRHLSSCMFHDLTVSEA